MEVIFDRYRDIIPDFPHFQESLHTPLPTHLRVNRLKTRPSSLVRRLERRGMPVQRTSTIADTLYSAPGLEAPGNLLEYFLGHIHPQALTSCLAALALRPDEGSLVLDMCAAPGGKASHMAQIMKNSGCIIANELYPSRHIPLGHTLERLGVMNALITGYQAQEFPMKQRFDYIMADVPCSGEGRFRKIRPTDRYLVTDSVEKLPYLQKKIIMRGFDMLAEGGVMLYATCTYNPDENEEVVAHLLKNRPAARLLPIELGMDHEPGVLKWKGRTYDRQISRAARFYPHRVDSVGFFMARICR